MRKWLTDFFYFPKGDRVAIVLLLCLIMVSGSLFIYLNHFTFTDAVYQAEDDTVQREFVQFENELQDREPINYEEVQEQDEKPTTKPKSAKINKQKLDEGQTIDINGASAATLIRIPGIGETFAERIIDYRNSLGGFCSLEQLYEIKGITVKKFSGILPYIILTRKPKPIRINKASETQLASHPYLNDKQVQTIIALRQANKIKTIWALSDNENFTPKDIERLSAYLSFE